jgi:hypothetical protein
MPHITIEYMIMIPILLMQIIIFPYLAITMRNSWLDSNINLELQEICSHLASSMQQLYYTVNHASISSGSLTAQLNIPTSINDGYGNIYRYTIMLQNATNTNSHVRIMNITLSMLGPGGEASTLVTLGGNAAWQNNSTFPSNSASIIATKTPGSISLSFGDN